MTAFIKKSCFFLLFLAILSPSLSYAQGDEELSKEEKKEAREKKKKEKEESGKLMISPMIGPGYTPELGFLIGGGALFSWRTDKDDLSLTRSNMPMMLSYSSTGAVTLNVRPSTYWKGDKIRANANFWFKNMPDNYFGVGFDTNNATDQDDDITAYDRIWIDLRADVLFKLKQKSAYAGIILNVNSTKGYSETDWIKDDPYYAAYDGRQYNAGLGVMYRYDGRDLPANAWSGMYFNAEFTQYGHYLAGNNNYNVLLLDYRQYTRINKKDGHILAWQVATRNSFGDVPYNELSQLGTPFDLRGYTWGKYRNKGMTYGIVEYRHTFSKQNGELSKIGAVAWVGGGTIYDTDNDPLIDDSAGFLPNGGIGMRFELQPRMNLRIDYGMGRNGLKGFYFNINETF